MSLKKNKKNLNIKYIKKKTNHYLRVTLTRLHFTFTLLRPSLKKKKTNYYTKTFNLKKTSLLKKRKKY